jgi:hypothetical protein
MDRNRHRPIAHRDAQSTSQCEGLLVRTREARNVARGDHYARMEELRCQDCGQVVPYSLTAALVNPGLAPLDDDDAVDRSLGVID